MTQREMLISFQVPELPKGTRCAYCGNVATSVEWEGDSRVPICTTHREARR